MKKKNRRYILAIYEFQCKKCNKEYTELCAYDETGKWAKVKCPECGSKKKEKLISACTFTFAQPEGTDLFNNSQDYRWKKKFLPKALAERQEAEALSHMGNPYVDNSADDIELDTGIHDPETRKGLS